MNKKYEHLKSNINKQQNLPFASIVLVLGIVSILGCSCMGIIGAIAGIIALLLYKKDRVRYIREPEKYYVSSFNNLKSGRILAIIGLILSSLFLVFILISIVTENQDYIMSFPWKMLR
jgi:hypothetical protein